MKGQGIAIIELEGDFLEVLKEIPICRVGGEESRPSMDFLIPYLPDPLASTHRYSALSPISLASNVYLIGQLFYKVPNIFFAFKPVY